MNEMITINPSSAPSYRNTDALAVEVAGEEGEFVQTLVASRAFQRLKDIRFLGGIDYLLVPNPNGASSNVRYTRAEHSIGVLRLTCQYANTVGLPPAKRRLAYAAALLHDIGHSPLSHSLEPVFLSIFGIDHHHATEDIIFGRVAIGHDVRQALEEFGVDPDEIVSVLSGESDPCDNFFRGPINFDTIEGILRSRRYATSRSSGLIPETVVQSSIFRVSDADKDIVDTFWSYKEQVYSLVVRSRDGVMADHLCQSLALRSVDRLKIEDYYRTEPEMFRRLPELRKALGMKISEAIKTFQIELPTTFVSRSFFVDPSSDFFDRDDKSRYKQKKYTTAFGEVVDTFKGNIPRQIDFLENGRACPSQL